MEELRTPGNYRGRLVDHGVKENEKNPEAVDITLVFDLDYHEDREGEQHQVGGRAWVRMFPREGKSSEIAAEQLKKLGVEDPAKLALPVEKSGLSGLGCDLWMRHEEYNGKDQERWSIAGERQAVESTATAGSKLKALFGASLKPRPRSTPATKTKAAPASADGEDDTPF
jgi:hypothetical protein